MCFVVLFERMEKLSKRMRVSENQSSKTLDVANESGSKPGFLELDQSSFKVTKPQLILISITNCVALTNFLLLYSLSKKNRYLLYIEQNSLIL